MLNGKTVVVLGGSAGIGLAVAEAAAKDGARVVVASSNQARVNAAVARVGAAQGLVVDLRSEPAIRAFFERIGALDHLVFTAGEELLLAPVADVDLAKARYFFELRYWGSLTAVKAAVPYLSKDGSIVLTGGLASRRPHPGFAIGSSVFGALDGLTRALAVELAPIRVNIVTPGFVDSELWSNIPLPQRQEMFAAAAAKLPLAHVAKPAELAEHYLGFMRGTYVTGQSLVVDGGGALV